MRISLRSKLIIGYAVMLVSVVVAALYGYYSFSKTIKRKEIIRFYTDNLVLSNKIYQYMSEAKNAENEFLLSFDIRYAETVIQRLFLLQRTTKELQKLSIQNRDPNQIEIMNAIVESTTVYLETFHDIKASIIRRGTDSQSGLRGKLKSIRLKLAGSLPANMKLNLQLLELKSLANYLDAESYNYPDKMFKVISEHLINDANPQGHKQWLKYKNFFHRLYFEDMNIRDLISLMRLNIEMISIFVIENVISSEMELEKQFTLTNELEQKQKIISLLVTIVTISAGLLVIIGFGNKPLALSRLNQEKAAILESIRDGLVAVNRDADVTLINQRAKDLLGLKQDFVGKHILDLFPNSRLPEVMKSGIAEYDQEQQRGKITVLTTRIPVLFQNKIVGAIVCFRRKEELSRLAGKLTQVNSYIDALRANNHEFKNKLQTIQGMIQLGKIPEVLSFIQTVQTSHQQQISLFVDHIKDPALSAILLGKYNRANELGISMFLVEQSKLSTLPPNFDQNGLVSIMGNLIQNAIDAVRDLKHMKRMIRIYIKEFPESIYFSVVDNGYGIEPDIAGEIFKQGFSTKQQLNSGISITDKNKEDNNIGMGLYIAQNHVISMGGNIQFKSGRETTFEVTIPKNLSLTDLTE